MVCILWLYALHRVTLCRGGGSNPSEVQTLELLMDVVMRVVDLSFYEMKAVGFSCFFDEYIE